MNRDLWSYLAETFWVLVTIFLFMALTLGITCLAVALAWVLGLCRGRPREPLKPSWPERIFPEKAQDDSGTP